jgi:hypothetical protein
MTALLYRLGERIWLKGKKARTQLSHLRELGVPVTLYDPVIT